MLQGHSFVWACIGVLMICRSAIAESVGLQEVKSRDYFSLVNVSIGAHSRSLVRDIERNHLEKAIVNLRQGRTREAINDCIYVLNRIVNHPKGLAILSLSAKLVKEPSLPLPYYERALKLYPAYAMTHAQYGKYLSEIGKGKEGVKRLQHAIEINPEFQIAYTWLARLYVKLGQPDQAREILQRSQAIVVRQSRQTEVLPTLDGDANDHKSREEKSIGSDPLWPLLIEKENSFGGTVKDASPYRLEEKEDRSGGANFTE